jgi:hypothetical protein
MTMTSSRSCPSNCLASGRAAGPAERSGPARARWRGAPPDHQAGPPARRRPGAVGARAAPAAGPAAVRGGDDQGLELPGVGAGGHDGGAGGVQDPQRLSVSPLARRGEVVAGEGFTASPDGVQHIALGAVAPRGPLGPVDLDHPLALVDQKPGQPGPIAARPFQRPDPPARRPDLGQPEQPGMAGPVTVVPPRGDANPGRCQPTVAVWKEQLPCPCSRARLTPSSGLIPTVTATPRPCWTPTAGCGPPWRCQARGHAQGRTGFSIRPAAMVGQAGAGSSRTDQPQGTPSGGQRGLGSLSLPAPACQHPDQAPHPASQRGLVAQGRSAPESPCSAAASAGGPSRSCACWRAARASSASRRTSWPAGSWRPSS